MPAPKNHHFPNFIGIGAPKSGTTWLARCLGEHPDIFMAAVKEVNFLIYPEIDGRLPEYERHFAAATSEKRVGEFTSRYLASKFPPPRIRELMPDARIIVCLRNPVDQIYSHYWHLSRQNFHEKGATTKLNFEEALDRYRSILVEPAYYWRHLQYWFKYLSAEQFHLILFDDILERPKTVLREVFAFLEVDTEFSPAALDEQSSATRVGVSPRNYIAQKLHAYIYIMLVRMFYQPMKRKIGLERADKLKEMLRIRGLMERVFFRSGYPKMAIGMRRKLIEKFDEDICGLESHLNRKLTSWRSL
jgi:hypothetical protein